MKEYKKKVKTSFSAEQRKERKEKGREYPTPGCDLKNLRVPEIDPLYEMVHGLNDRISTPLDPSPAELGFCEAIPALFSSLWTFH